MIKNIINQWKQSCDLYSKRELLIFVFTWMRTVKSSCIVFFKYFWWLAAISVAIQMYHVSFHISPATIKEHLGLYMLSSIGLIAILFISFFFMLLSVRASIEIKNFSYFVSKLKKLPWIFLLNVGNIIFVVFFALITILPFGPLKAIHPHLLRYLMFVFDLMVTLFLLLTVQIASFLIVDNHARLNGFQIIKNSMKSVFFYLPILAPLSILIFGVVVAFRSVSSFLHPLVGIVGSLALVFLWLPALSILYLRMKHKDHTLFFGK